MTRDSLLLGVFLLVLLAALVMLLLGPLAGALLPAALGLAALAGARRRAPLWWRALRRSPSPPLDLDEVDLSGVREPVVACAACGSLCLRALRWSDAAEDPTAEFPLGEGLRVCRRCGRRGEPAVLETREEYRRFLKRLADRR